VKSTVLDLRLRERRQRRSLQDSSDHSMLAILSTTPAVHSSAELYEPAAAVTAPYPTAGGVARRSTGGGGATRRRRGPWAVVPQAQPGPSVVLLYHIEKTGGSAVMKWLKRQTHAPSRLAAVYSYSQTSCFFALHADLFPGMEPRWRDKLCGGAAPLDWRSSKVAVEFHSYSKGFFLRSVLPALGALKRRYAEANGTVVAVTSIREPASHLLSKYRMWPPRTADRTHAVPLPAWLASGEAHSLQSRALLSERPALPGCEGLTEARALLGQFDLVGVTHCLRPLLAAIEERLGLPHDPARTGAALAAYHRPQHWGGAIGREASEWTASRLNATGRRLLGDATRCDESLYSDALRRQPPPLETKESVKTLCQPPAAAAQWRIWQSIPRAAENTTLMSEAIGSG